MKKTNEQWAELIRGKMDELTDECLTVFKKSLLTEYNPFYMTTDVILNEDGKIYAIDHTGNSIDPDVFNGKAKVIYSLTDRNIFDDWNDEESEVLELLEDNDDKETFITWLKLQYGNDIDLEDYLTISSLKEYAESEYVDLGLISDFEGVIENVTDNLVERIGDEINHKIDMVIWELENYQ